MRDWFIHPVPYFSAAESCAPTLCAGLEAYFLKARTSRRHQSVKLQVEISIPKSLRHLVLR